MKLDVAGHPTYAYTGARTLVPAQRYVVFAHGAANDHSVWTLQSRYFAHHGGNVLAIDLPGHGRSGGGHCRRSKRSPTGLPRCSTRRSFEKRRWSDTRWARSRCWSARPAIPRG